MPTERVGFLGVGFDRLGMDEVLGRLREVTVATPYGYVVTPNVDHVVRLDAASDRDALISLYENADLSLCDSRVLRQLARLHDLELPLVPGSDLTVRLFQEVVRPGDRIAVVGGDDQLLAALRDLHPELDFVHYSPPMGLRHNAEARAEAARFVAEAKARFSFIAVGSPQQEMIAAAVCHHSEARGMALCIGASLNFVTGREQRAPAILQKLSLEWAYRLLVDPKRMWRRYLVEGPRVFVLAARHKRSVAPDA